ncbi:hypothetical protein O6H91_02G148900 [Diphasiastrum complanatum]|uniref:Uncharacterized protein n=1 Tax=Diphasiastrum complanatum TaxID=34168 RepID=A0ACC2EM47_DIPCM|nr:hypothetical protein O6H91_02G148900 [Diphasiastrum complanatum]
MNARLRLIVFWFLAQTVVHEESVSAFRMVGAFPKLGSSTSIMDHMYKKHAVEGIESKQQVSKGATNGSIDGAGYIELAYENEHEQSTLNGKEMSSNSRLLSSLAKLPSTLDHVEESDVEERDVEQTVKGLQVVEIDYIGRPSTHPPPIEN